MKSYKIWILFILLSVVSFSESETKIDVWVEKVGFDLSTNTLILTIKSRTGIMFNEMEKLKISGLVITNGVNEETHDVVASNEGKTGESPKVITSWVANIQLGFNLVNELIEIKNGGITVIPLDGNQHAINNKTISFDSFTPAPDGKTELKIYEKLEGIDDWKNKTTSPESDGITNVITGAGITVDGYIFTKGGPGSLEEDPGVYALISSDEVKISELWVEKNGDGVDDGIDDLDDIEILDISSETGIVAMKISGFISDGKNTITVIPISEFGFEGDKVSLDFVIDTQINTLYLEDGIIGEIEEIIIDEDKGKEPGVIVDLADIKELSGIKWYSYTLKVGDKTEPGGEVSVSGESYLEPSKDSKLGIVEIPTSGFIAGSKGTLLFTVYDRLGHEKTFEKTYFIPKKLEGINAKVSDEAKQRESKIKVVTEGSSDKFGVESSIDTSSE